MRTLLFSPCVAASGPEPYNYGTEPDPRKHVTAAGRMPGELGQENTRKLGAYVKDETSTVTRISSGEHPEENLALISGDTLFVP